MNDLRINFEETKQVGNQVVSKAEEFQTLLNKVKSVNSELKAYWEGTDASKYTASVEQQAAYMQKLSDTVNEIGDFLYKVGTEYERVSQSNADAIR